MLDLKKLNFLQKIQFLPYFPYGLCSRQATTITGRANRHCTKLLLGDDKNDLVEQCVKFKARTTERAKYACKRGLARDTEYQCGSPKMPHPFRAMTKQGLQAIVGATDEAIADIEDNVELNGEREHDGKIKDTEPGSISRRTASLREELHEYANSPDPEDQATFHELLLDAVISGQATPLTAGLPILSNVKITTSKYSQFQYYNIWRHSHVNAMFQANGHLTYLDRRPYDTKFALDGIYDEESYHAYTQKHGCTMAALTYRALTDWYANNPDYYSIKQQYPDDSDDAYNAWLNTPAFYAASELPTLGDKERGNYVTGLTGSQKKLNSIAIGLATGKRVNYMCYHAKPGSFNWVLPREKKTQAEAEAIVREMKMRCPQMHCANTVKNAFYFCTSYHQFLALFDRTREKFKKGQKTNHPMSAPYLNMHAIPVNDGGAFLLWCLLEEGPTSIQHSICNSLVARDIGFVSQVHAVFPLRFRGKHVFAGYTMNVPDIHKALEHYLEGYDFYICCFPEQVKWYAKLFPGITIL